jgi:uncharacterized membrane protein
MPQYLVAYFATVIVFLGIDFVWLTKIANQFYAAQLGDLLLENPKLGPAAVFYLFYVVGIVFFAVMPALRGGGLSTAIFSGALLGAIAYATYDVSNYATLKNWPINVLFVDIAWGTVLTSVSAAAGYLITRAMTSS